MANKAGNTALHEAVRNRRGPVAEGLLDADPSRAYDLNEQMESPLHMAAREGLVQVVRKIFDFTWEAPGARSGGGAGARAVGVGSRSAEGREGFFDVSMTGWTHMSG